MASKEIDIFDMFPPEHDRLLQLYREHAFQVGEFPLASGKISKVYFNSKAVTLLPEGAFLIARAILEKIKDLEVDAIGGAAIGAAPMAGSLAVLCHLDNRFRHVKFFVDRKKPKQHGDRKQIEGPGLEPGARVVVIEDVTTSGNSALNTARKMQELYGCEIVKVIALLDRKEGARELFESSGIAFDPVLTRNELEIEAGEE